jgi:hypothetical protein
MDVVLFLLPLWQVSPCSVTLRLVLRSLGIWSDRLIRRYLLPLLSFSTDTNVYIGLVLYALFQCIDLSVLYTLSTFALNTVDPLRLLALVIFHQSHKGMVRSDVSKPALIFFTARVHTTKSTVKILAANTHCKYFLKIFEVTNFFCTRNRLYQRCVQPS